MEWFWEKVDQFPLKLSFFFACAMVIGSVVPYIPQYFTIKQSQNTEGFSLYVCLTLLVANILRIMFWFGKHFETALLIQSIVMIIAMFGLLELCVRVRNSNLIIQGRKHYFADFDLRYFWEWTDFLSYLECMAIFAFFTGLIMFFFIHEPLVVEAYGLVALVTESLLASPQFLRNWKTKSTEGMSRMMVFTWFLGDVYKTAYFVVRSAPFQFILCGFTQITFDILIFLQILFYKKASYRKLAKAGKPTQVSPSIQEDTYDDDHQDSINMRLKARHVSFSNPEVSQEIDIPDTDDISKTGEEIDLHKID